MKARIKSPVGHKISRSEALRISTQTLIQAEEERLAISELERIEMKTDTELLDWLEEHGWGYALINDDNGHWACLCDGLQSVAAGTDPVDVQTVYWIEKRHWKDSVREAINDAMNRED